MAKRYSYGLSWTLLNEYGDRIERITSKIDMRKERTVSFSYWGVVDGKRIWGQLNKIKKAFNDFRGKKTKWNEVWE